MYPIVSLGNIGFSAFPAVLMVGLCVCVVIFVCSAKYPIGRVETLMKSLILVFVGAAIGGRLLSAAVMAQMSGYTFWNRLLYGGFVFYGGLFGGAVGCFLFCKKRHQSTIDLIDVYCSLLPLAQAFGRIGCYLNGCCYGKGYEGVFSVAYYVDGVKMRVFPTWFVEALFCLLLAVFLQIVCRTQRRGVHTAIYLISYSLFRFCIEFVRGDIMRGVNQWGTVSQAISLILFFLGIGFAVFCARSDAKNSWLQTRRGNCAVEGAPIGL